MNEPIVTVNGRRFPAEYDKHGTLRFKKQRLVNYLVDNCKDDLNKLWIMQQEDLFTLDEMRLVYMMMGYSVAGYMEVFEDDIVTLNGELY